MKTIKKYTKIYFTFMTNGISRDLSFRLSFFMGFVGSFCYVGLNFFLVYFIFRKLEFGPWSEKEIYVLLGNFYILSYGMFFFFWRGYLYLTRNIRNGNFDFALVRPADSQFLVSLIGGSVHNLVAIVFGFLLMFYGLHNLGVTLGLFQFLAWMAAMTISLLACYSYIFILITLNFKFGYLEELISFAFTFQDFSRYPLDAFNKVPVFLLLFALPFSALTTIPSLILISSTFPLQKFLIFAITSATIIIAARLFWFRALRNYTSGN